jgi:hypothetical protein
LLRNSNKLRVAFDIFAGFASIVSLLGWAGENIIGYTPNELMFLSFTLLFLFITYSIIFLFLSHQEYNRTLRTKNDFQLSHKITHNLRNALSKLRDVEFETSKKLDKAKEDSHIEEVKKNDSLMVSKIFKVLGSKLSDSVHKQVLNSLSRQGITENIRVTIKSLEPRSKNQKDWIVRTLILDPASWAESDHSDLEPNSEPVHTVGENTDFSEILVNRSHCYANNNLDALGDDTYLNSSKDWRKRYNATMVVPIKNKPKDGDSVVYYGFLTLDSLNSGNKNLFSNDVKDEILQITAHAADALASWFIRYDVHSDMLETHSAIQEGEMFLFDYISKKVKK